MPPETPVGLFGVGLMGEVYAARLIAAGFGVIGFDTDVARMKRLVQIGGRAGSAVEIARHCDPIVIAVFSTDQVEAVVERALVPAASGKIVICTSTCDPDRVAALGARVARDLRFLEAPVSGTSAQVRQGDGVGLMGGDVETAQIAASVLDALFPQRFHSARSVTTVAPSSPSISSLGSIASPLPRAWCLLHGLVSTLRHFFSSRAPRQPLRR